MTGSLANLLENGNIAFGVCGGREVVRTPLILLHGINGIDAIVVGEAKKVRRATVFIQEPSSILLRLKKFHRTKDDLMISEALVTWSGVSAMFLSGVSAMFFLERCVRYVFERFVRCVS